MDLNTQETLEKFATVIRELTDTAEYIARIEENKAVVASEKRHQLLDGLIQDEQAQISYLSSDFRKGRTRTANTFTTIIWGIGASVEALGKCPEECGTDHQHKASRNAGHSGKATGRFL